MGQPANSDAQWRLWLPLLSISLRHLVIAPNNSIHTSLPTCANNTWDSHQFLPCMANSSVGLKITHKRWLYRIAFLQVTFPKNNPRRALFPYPYSKLLFLAQSFTILLLFKLAMKDLIIDLLDLATECRLFQNLQSSSSSHSRSSQL